MKKIITVFILANCFASVCLAQIDSNRNANDTNTLSRNKATNKNSRNQDSINMEKKKPPRKQRDATMNIDKLIFYKRNNQALT